MTDSATSIATLLQRVEDHSKSTIDLHKLNALDKSANVISFLVSRLAIFLMVALSLLIVNTGFALWIGKLLGNSFYGLFVIGGFYSLLAILLHAFRHRWLKYPMGNSIIKQLLKQK